MAHYTGIDNQTKFGTAYFGANSSNMELPLHSNVWNTGYTALFQNHTITIVLLFAGPTPATQL